MQISFDRIATNETQKKLYTDMRAVRVSLEWSYKELKQMWAIKDYARLLKVYKDLIGLIYTDSVILLNFKNCIEIRGPLSSFF